MKNLNSKKNCENDKDELTEIWNQQEIKQANKNSALTRGNIIMSEVE